MNMIPLPVSNISPLSTGLAAMVLLIMMPALAQELPPQPGRYMPFYPGMYLTGAYSHDTRDSSYDQTGTLRDSAAPQAGGKTKLATDNVLSTFTWHFPMFESYGLPFISSTTHMARVTLRYSKASTDGALKSFISSKPDLMEKGDGLGDTTLEFGSFLYGAQDWRTRTQNPFTLLALVGVNVPTGVYESNAPNNTSSNTWAFHGKLGAQWQPWTGGYLEAGGGYRSYAGNEEPEFGALAPHRQGKDRFWDLSVTQRIWQSLYVGVFLTQRKGDANEYRNPQFTPNPDAPTPPANSDNYPTPGVYFDKGTELSTLGLSLQYFLTQHWLAALHFTKPISGRSGQFQLPYTNRTPANCIVGSLTCQTSDSGSSVLVDGMGPARSFGTNNVTLTLSYNFDLGDFFSCTGCKQ